MKYGKEFQQILDASDFPDDWKTSAIEYRKLKKLIKNVVAELEGMGLAPTVLHRLLVTENGNAKAGESQITEIADTTPQSEEDSVFEFEFDVDPNAAPQPSVSPKEVLVDPVFDDDAESIAPSVHESNQHHHRFRVRLRSDVNGGVPDANGFDRGTSPNPEMSGSLPRPVSVTEMLRTRSEGIGAPLAQVRSRSPAPSGVVVRAGTDQGNVTAEYVLAGDEENPVPQIRLHVSNFEAAPVRRNSLSTTSGSRTGDSTPGSSHAELQTEDDDDESESASGSDAALVRTIRGRPAELPAVPPSPSLLKTRTAASPIWAIASAGNVDGMRDLSLGEAADPDEYDDVIDLTTPTMAPRVPPQPSMIDLNGTTGTPPEREFIIPLQSDLAFFNVLTAALKSLSAFHLAQQQQFQAAVKALCRSVSNSIQPGDGPVVIPAPLHSSPTDGAVTRFEYSSSTSVSQKDLYAWREIFSLWVESEIFESNAERDRGERTVNEAERRLKVFANEVVKRGLGDRRSLRGKRTRKAWEEFLRLNVLLLDLKRFQMANINAAKKILKKHDKRTALTASTGLASFVRSTLTDHVDKDGNVSTWTFYNTSLPHVLLASLTDTLLPILPSLDDYACLICMSIAFKPIRLGCGHLFCVRCLVKMQQRRKEQCPLCRSPEVLLADKSCLDVALMSFMKDWFPKEVKEKQRDNSSELAKEQLQDAGLDTRCRVM